MNALEKHNLLVTALLGLVILPACMEIILYPAYRIAAAIEVHIPSDVIRSGPVLAGISAVLGGLVGIGVGWVGATGQTSYASWAVTVSCGILLILLGGAIFSVLSLLVLRRGFLPSGSRQKREWLGPATWWYTIRRLQAEPYVTATEQQDYFCYAAELMMLAEHNQEDSLKIADALSGFGTFLYLYFGNKEFRDRNGVRLPAVCCCGLAVVIASSAVWLLAGTWFSSEIILPAVLAEIFLWILLRWRYERVRLINMASARRSAADDIRHLAIKKLRLQQGTPVRATGSRDLTATALSAAAGIAIGCFSWSLWRRLQRL